MPYFAAAMARNQRIGLVVAAIVVAVVGFLIANPGDEDAPGDQAARATTEQPTTEAETEPGAEPETTKPPEPEVARIEIRGGEVVGGSADISVQNGDVVRIVVSSDTPDDLHLHGYDIEKPAAPGQPARFRVRANIEGSFEMESHVAEDAGRDPIVARLNVEPK